MSDLNQSIYWAWLASCRGMKPDAFERAVKTFGSPKQIYALARSRPTGLRQLGERLRGSISAAARDDSIQKLYALIERHGLNVITSEDDEYPERLAQLEDAPPVLYTKGEGSLKDLDAAVAVVGSRKCTEYGRSAAYDFAKTLAQSGVCVVSGLAMGIDTAAHEGALDSGAAYATVAVLAGGAEKAVPASQEELYRRVLQNGLAVSEKPPDSAVTSFSFPVRNRIMAGLSKAVLVVEAEQKSGTWHTVNSALELGRDVFAIPGRITDPFSIAPLQLIRDGAYPALSPEDILGVMGWQIPARQRPEDQTADYSQLSPESQSICAALKAGAKTRDELIELTGFAADKLLPLLTILQTQGIIKRNGACGYSL